MAIPFSKGSFKPPILLICQFRLPPFFLLPPSSIRFSFVVDIPLIFGIRGNAFNRCYLGRFSTSECFGWEGGKNSVVNLCAC
ncbi:hypothetical protein V6Z12_A01G159200 [Gossypium hirsutum]